MRDISVILACKSRKKRLERLWISYKYKGIGDRGLGIELFYTLEKETRKSSLPVFEKDWFIFFLIVRAGDRSQKRHHRRRSKSGAPSPSETGDRKTGSEHRIVFLVGTRRCFSLFFVAGLADTVVGAWTLLSPPRGPPFSSGQGRGGFEGVLCSVFIAGWGSSGDGGEAMTREWFSFSSSLWHFTPPFLVITFGWYTCMRCGHDVIWILCGMDDGTYGHFLLRIFVLAYFVNCFESWRLKLKNYGSHASISIRMNSKGSGIFN